MFHVEHPLQVCCWPGLCCYERVLQRMQQLTLTATPDTPDQLWLLQHRPVFTLGVNSQIEHLHSLSGRIPVVQSDRGGQVTYHGPGQWVVYLLLDVRRLNIGVKQLVAQIEQVLVAWLCTLGLEPTLDPQARGVYVAGRKIASLGLRIKQGRCYHGFSLNVAMDLTPFTEINPCGLTLGVTQVADWVNVPPPPLLTRQMIQHVVQVFGYTSVIVQQAEAEHEFL